MPGARSASLAVFVGAGSRLEDRTNAGTGHFLEHIVFKGTAKRPTAAQISQDIESRGGAVNAATDKEVTVFWSRLPARHWRVALDVIADLIQAPMLRPADVETEKRVVIEELRMYRDQPQDRVHTILDELLYPRHPLGWEVAGREPVVNALDAEQLRDFMRRGYVPSSIVVAVAGKVIADEVFAAVADLFAGIEARVAPRLTPAPKAGRARMKLLGKRTEQAHVCIGWRGVPQEHPDKYALDMLNAILGEGMSSRLFLELREKRALAYDVHSFNANFVDAGHLAIYAGVTPDRITEVIEAALAEVAKLRDQVVP
ncbi:MAG: pitrilysin family protein, partial [Chloroflexota bacterium]